jgi:hypothetical protein
MAFAAASFISSLILEARQANAPRKMPGKQSTFQYHRPRGQWRLPLLREFQLAKRV